MNKQQKRSARVKQERKDREARRKLLEHESGLRKRAANDRIMAAVEIVVVRAGTAFGLDDLAARALIADLIGRRLLVDSPSETTQHDNPGPGVVVEPTKTISSADVHRNNGARDSDVFHGRVGFDRDAFRRGSSQ